MIQTILTITALLLLILTTAARIPPAAAKFIHSLPPFIHAIFKLRNEIRTARASLDSKPNTDSEAPGLDA